jgi:Uma2 family endonuclease
MKVNSEMGILTGEDYLEREKSSEMKHEFMYGELIDIPGNTKLHELIKKRLSRVLDSLPGMAGFETYTSDIKVSIEDGNIYFYPDVVLVKADEQSVDDYIAIKPLLVVEVLSDSTRSYDTVDKYIQYRKIPTLQYYLLVEPETMLITCLTKQEDGEWISNIFTKPDATITLDKLNTSIRIGDVYGV